jgi:chemotaxis protein MotB
MAGSNDHKCPAVGVPAYMATLADMFSLLLTFFILLLSFSTMDVIKFQSLAKSLHEALGRTSYSAEGIFMNNNNPIDFETLGRNSPSSLSLEGSAQHQIVVKEIKENEQLAQDIAKVVAEAGLEDTVTVQASSRGVLMQVQGQVFFDPGTAHLKAMSAPFLDEVARIIASSEHNVSIEGHTDDSPIHTVAFPSNWELSTARAISTLRYLVDSAGIEADRLSSAGFADTRPLVPNDTAEHQRENRRVEFVIFKDDREAF